MIFRWAYVYQISYQRLSISIFLILGNYSGARLASLLPHTSLLVAGLTAYLSGLLPEAVESPLPDDRKFPPTFFAHMPRDEDTARAVEWR